ncbi:hypothetical protein EWM64_g9623 [Hericium alpestre]|uniref:MSP domain-containing protein n=1 Tax=Hericium alpestre TaxID=135208 RepID=A0A4Y9ZLT5_9AGAM|nr:hypothetical protein EWM64_g9623 [Hericium alpestre]
MSVNLQPSSTLGFNRPLTQNVKRALAISNPNAQPVAFKVKTTAPKLYCVRPNSGRVEPGETAEVQVMLQAMKEEPPLNAKCKDKFLIQSTLITEEKNSLPLGEVWNVQEGDELHKIHSQKIKVAYLPPEGVAVEEEDENAPNMSVMSGAGDVRGHSNIALDAVLNMMQQFGSTRQYPAGNGHPADQESILRDRSSSHQQDRAHTPPADFAAAREEAHEESPRAGTKPELPQGGVGVVNVNVHTTPPATPPSAPATVPAPAPKAELSPELAVKYQEAVAKNQEAQAEIQRLRALLAAVPDPSSVASSGTTPTELRRRHRPMSDDGTTVVSSDAGTYLDEGILQPEGVPLQVVVIVALIVFITTYLFF